MKYFLMSIHFNKKTPDDFGLEYIDGKYIRQEDGTEWIPCELYDFGWGDETGFYRVPLGNFEKLINIVDGSDREDSYGAAAIIENLYPKELKSYLLDLMTKGVADSTRKKLNEFFRLKEGVNKTAFVNMNFAQIRAEYNDWLMIAEFYSK